MEAGLKAKINIHRMVKVSLRFNYNEILYLGTNVKDHNCYCFEEIMLKVKLIHQLELCGQVKKCRTIEDLVQFA